MFFIICFHKSNGAEVGGVWGAQVPGFAAPNLPLEVKGLKMSSSTLLENLTDDANAEVYV